MRATKYSISFFLFLLALGLVGEYQYFHLDQFYTKYDSTTMYAQPMFSQEQMKQDIQAAAAQHDVELFAFTRTLEGSGHVRYDIYGTEHAQSILEKREQILEEKTYKTLLLGSLSYHFHPLSDIPNMEEISHYYAVHNAGNLEAFKVSLIDKYAGNFPQEGYGEDEARFVVAGIWGILLLTLLLLAYYDVLYKRKESAIRYTMGESPLYSYTKHVLTDTVAMLILFCVAYIIVAQFTLSSFFSLSGAIFIISLVLGNIMLHLYLLRIDLKEAFSNSKGANKKLLIWNYSAKVISSIVTILIITSNIAVIYESIQLYRQSNFFKDRADYYYITVKLPFIFDEKGAFNDQTDRNMLLQTKLYKDYFDIATPLLLADSYDLYGYQGVIANRHAIPYISEQLSSVQLNELTSSYIFLVPEKLQGKAEAHYFDMMLSLYEGEEAAQYQVIYYQEEIDMVRINQLSLTHSEWVHNPIVFLNNKDQMSLTVGDEPRRAAFMQEVMYRMSQDALAEFISHNGLKNSDIIYTNVYSLYLEKWRTAKQLLMVNLLFSSLVLVLQGFMMLTIIKLEYDLNAMELAIKKIVGYSKWQRYKKLVLASGLANLVGTVIAMILAYILDIALLWMIAAGGLAILLLELVGIVMITTYMERLRVQKILKGGAL